MRARRKAAHIFTQAIFLRDLFELLLPLKLGRGTLLRIASKCVRRVGGLGGEGEYTKER